MNAHLITYAEYLERLASKPANVSQYIDRGFSAEQARVYRERAELVTRAGCLRRSARSPEQVIADELAAERARQHRNEREEKYQAQLRQIAIDAAFPLFERLKLEGIGTPAYFAARYRDRLPALEQMFKDKHQQEAS